MRLLALQPTIGRTLTTRQRCDNVARLAALIEHRVRDGLLPKPNLVMLPELATIDYSIDSFECLSRLAEPIDGSSFETFSAVARTHGVYLGYGFPRIADDKVYISYAIADPRGQLVALYDKIHIADFGASPEKRYFSPGSNICYLDIGQFRVGIITCYDFRFPDYVRTLADQHGVNIVLHPVAFTTDQTFPSWHHFVVTRALENQVYFLSLNRAGDRWGRSIFCPPWIDELTVPKVLGQDEGWQQIDISLATLEQTRRQYPLITDRRDDYAALAQSRLHADDGR